MKSLIFLLLSCSFGWAAFSSDDGANTGIIAKSANDALNLSTNEITISIWATRYAKSSGGGRLVTCGGLFNVLETAGTANNMDWLSDSKKGTGNTSLWRTTNPFDSTNVWNLFQVTYTYSNTNSMSYYTNRINMVGTWLQDPTNAAGTYTAGNKLAVGVDQSDSVARWLGQFTELAVWNKILNSQQLDMLYRSKVKGIAKQIEPSFLRCYYSLDQTPFGVPMTAGKNSQPNYGTFTTANLAHALTGTTRPMGTGESLHSYQPNE